MIKIEGGILNKNQMKQKVKIDNKNNLLWILLFHNKFLF
jgi:hypothetical protein